MSLLITPRWFDKSVERIKIPNSPKGIDCVVYGEEKLELYQIDYRLHTTTPDKVFIAGGMDLDDEGWLLPTYPNSTYLVFSVEDEEKPVYLFSLMENDCSPGDELFTSDLMNTLRNRECEEIQDVI